MQILLQIERSFTGQLRFSHNLRTLLGFSSDRFTASGNLIGNKIADINEGFHSIHVYCDLLEPRVVGDVFAPLLSVIPIQGYNGDYIHQRYENIHYHPLLTKNLKNFCEIRITLRDDPGEKVKFESGKVIVTLHLRKKKLSDL